MAAELSWKDLCFSGALQTSEGIPSSPLREPLLLGDFSHVSVSPHQYVHERFLSVYTWSVVQRDMKSRHRNPGPCRLSDVKLAWPFLILFFLEMTFLLRSSCSHRIRSMQGLWSQAKLDFSSPACIWVFLSIGAGELLPSLGWELKGESSAVSSLVLPDSETLPSQLSYHRNTGSGSQWFSTSWLLTFPSRQSGGSVTEEATHPMLLCTGSVIPFWNIAGTS